MNLPLRSSHDQEASSLPTYFCSNIGQRRRVSALASPFSPPSKIVHPAAQERASRGRMFAR